MPEHGAGAFAQHQRAVPAMVDQHQARRSDLPQHRLPGPRIGVLAGAEHRQLVVAEAGGLFGRLAGQHVDDVAGAEPLAGAVDGGHRLDGDLGAVPAGDRGEAGIAIAAAAGMGFAEMGEDGLAPAVGGFADGEQRLELGALDALDLVGCAALVDHPPALHDIRHAVAHPCFGRLAVAPGPAGFLVVGLDRGRHIHMGDIAHVGLVDAHAEGDGGHEAKLFLLEEGVLVGAAHRSRQARMIGQCPDAFLVQPRSDVLDLGPRQAIDDAAFAVVAGEEGQQLLAGIVALDDRIADVGPVEAGDEHPRRLKAEALDDVVAGERVGGGRQRHARDAGEELGDAGQFAIFGPEVVAPLAEAMGLVDGKERNVDAGQQLGEAGCRQPLGRHIEQVELAAREPAAHLGRLLGRQRRVEGLGIDACLAQRLDLVAHQRDQRRDHDADARPAEGRHLVAGRLAGPGGEQHHRIAAGRDVGDDVFLLAAKG